MFKSTSIFFAAFLMLFACIAVTLAVYFIYRLLYNKHLDKVLKAQTTKKWPSLLSVVLCAIVIEVVLCFGVVFLINSHLSKTINGYGEDGQLYITQDSDYNYLVSCKEDMEVKSYANDLADVTSYKSSKQIFAEISIKDASRIDYFIVYEGDEVTETKYKNEEEEHFDKVPLFINKYSDDEDIRVTMVLENSGDEVLLAQLNG